MYTASRSPWRASQCSDADLLKRLDQVELTANERKSVEAGMAYMVEKGHLPKTVRDHLCCIARAKGVLAKTQHKKREGSPIGDVGFDDRFSVKKTAGTAYAERLLARPLPKRPPGKAA